MIITVSLCFFLRKDIFHKLKTNFTLEMVPGTCEFSLFSNLYFYSNFCLVTEDGTDLFLIMNHLLSGKSYLQTADFCFQKCS